MNMVRPKQNFFAVCKSVNEACLIATRNWGTLTCSNSTCVLCSSNSRELIQMPKIFRRQVELRAHWRKLKAFVKVKSHRLDNSRDAANARWTQNHLKWLFDPQSSPCGGADQLEENTPRCTHFLSYWATFIACFNFNTLYFYICPLCVKHASVTRITLLYLHIRTHPCKSRYVYTRPLSTSLGGPCNGRLWWYVCVIDAVHIGT